MWQSHALMQSARRLTLLTIAVRRMHVQGALPPAQALEPAASDTDANSSTDGAGRGGGVAAQQLQLPGGQSLAAFMGMWDLLTARLLPRDTTGPAAETLLAALQLLLASMTNAANPAPLQGPSPVAGSARPLLQAPAPKADLELPALDGQLLAVALQLADLSAGGVPLDAEAIAAGVLADAVQRGALSMDAVQVHVA